MLYLTVLTLFGFVLILGQGSFSTLAVRPNLIIVIALYAGQFYPPMTGLILSFILGYFLDLMSGSLLGLNAFSMVSICYLAFLLSGRIVIQNRIAQLVIVFLFYLVYGVIVYLLFRFFNFEVNKTAFLLTNLRDGAVASLLSIPTIFVIRKMERFFRFVNERVSSQGNIQL